MHLARPQTIRIWNEYTGQVATASCRSRQRAFAGRANRVGRTEKWYVSVTCSPTAPSRGGSSDPWHRVCRRHILPKRKTASTWPHPDCQSPTPVFRRNFPCRLDKAHGLSARSRISPCPVDQHPRQALRCQSSTRPSAFMRQTLRTIVLATRARVCTSRAPSRFQVKASGMESFLVVIKSRSASSLAMSNAGIS